MTRSEKENIDLILSSLKCCANFPKEGITFIDVFGVFANPEAHRALIDLIMAHVKSLNTKIDAVVGLDARGFVFGPQVALELQVPFVPVRKQGKLPGRVIKLNYSLEYGSDSTEMQIDSLQSGARVLLVDDLLATGGTLSAAQKLCAQIGCEVVETLVIVELIDLEGRKKLLNPERFTSLLKFSQADMDAWLSKQENS